MRLQNSSIAPVRAVQNLKQNMDRDIRQIRRKYTFLKIKWTLLFVLPILLIVVAYQVAKQFLRIKIREVGRKASNALPHKECSGAAVSVPDGGDKKIEAETKL